MRKETLNVKVLRPYRSLRMRAGQLQREMGGEGWGGPTAEEVEGEGGGGGNVTDRRLCGGGEACEVIM